MDYGERIDDREGPEAAVAEAQRRWGSQGAISIADTYRNARCLVGELRGGRFWIEGRGSSWRAAFADSEGRGVEGFSRRCAER